MAGGDGIAGGAGMAGGDGIAGGGGTTTVPLPPPVVSSGGAVGASETVVCSVGATAGLDVVLEVVDVVVSVVG
ncbi:hypothetical protein BTO20_23345 [Mycobacterium dioxanotrophicus]|jgi:hypothetical protein|uniref:Uncharacterized protein n=1 Tax=Mycobacterium dioxanotrophicus TaxID=482462 RepID=A0A1Y0C797_9MYCO|nr:hypothetical protein [Mycobacterium dioxanotrophicus]ART71083.1 hypothetical protein BTO20_23345 [Mycobacterium dioxanotrophicus]